jgi:PDZ domain-containing protein
LKFKLLPGIVLKLGWIKLRIDVTWLLVATLMVWGIIGLYVPVMGVSVSDQQAWGVGAIILALSFVSLVVHVGAHFATARILQEKVPEDIPLYLLADPAQVWSRSKEAGREAVIALAGPIAQALLGAFAFYIWNLQLDPTVSLVAFFLAIFNLAIAAINLTPAFPLDGGRLVRSILAALLRQPARGTWLAKWSGFWLIIAMVTWGVVLVTQQTRLEWHAAAISFTHAGLLAVSLFLTKTADNSDPEPHSDLRFKCIPRTIATALMILPLLLVTVSLMPLNYGLKAPGYTAPAESMIQVPVAYRHSSRGSLMLTSVIPQAPILIAEWLYAHLDRSVQLVPEEEIVPPDQTIQSQAEQGHRTLISSQTIAIVKGLRLAGYEVPETSEGVVVLSVLPDSPVSLVLTSGDLITRVDGQSIDSLTGLQELLRTKKEGEVLQLTILRSQQEWEVNVATLPPSQAGGPARIGIGAENYITGYSLPFPVTISSGKMIGGPSAGLMFTLAVYNLVTPGDVTQGWRIAGTGTIDLDGKVGPIGSVQQKVVAAERAGAEYFLAPAQNYQDALTAAGKIKVIKVASAEEAINFLRGLPPAGV